MIGRRLLSLFSRNPASQPLGPSTVGADRSEKPWARRLVSGVLISITGGFALSALDDLAIYHGSSRKAMERAAKSKEIVEAIGEPIERGPWYNASLAVAHRRHSVACTFPVSGPRGTAILQLKAVRSGDDTWLSFLRSRDWEILVMEALLHVPGNDAHQQTFRIRVPENLPSTACAACIDCKFQPSESIEKNAQAT